MFVNRSRPRGPDPFLEARLALFVAGATLGLVGILRDGEGWWVASGIGLLGAGMVLGMIQGVRERRRFQEDDEEEPPGAPG